MVDTSKFNLQKLISDVKSLINSVPIPEASKDDPVGYYLGEIGKAVQNITELQNQQMDMLTKLMETVGNLASILKQDTVTNNEDIKEPESNNGVVTK